MSTNIQDKIKTYLIQNFSIPVVKLTPDANLLDEWILDSIHLLSIAQFLESEFQIEIKAEDMDMTNFSTLSDVTSFVIRKKSQ